MRTRHTTRVPGVWYRLVDESRPDGPRRYIVSYYDSTGAKRSETLPVGAKLEDAQARRAELVMKKRQGPVIVTNETVAELLDRYLESRRDSLKPKTIEVYEYAVARLTKELGRTRVRDLSPDEIAAFTARLKREGMKTWTVKKILTPLVGALKVAVREGTISANPADKLLPHERPKSDQREMRCMSSEEIPMLLKAASTDRWRALFATLVFTGLRIGEALALTWDDVDDSIHVRSSKTKAGERSVLLLPQLRSRLAALRLKQPAGTQVVFANANGQPVSRREALRALRAAEKRAGLPEYTLHELRHTFASILIAQGETPVLVAHQLGHKDPSITLKTYAHLFDEAENVQLAKDRLQEAFGGMV